MSLQLAVAFARIENPPIMILQRTLGLMMKRWPYLVVLLGVIVYVRMQRYSPRQPDAASGHVFPVIVLQSHGRGRHSMVRHTIYLTSSERLLYHVCFVVIFVGTFGIIGQAVLNRKRNRATLPG